MPDHCHRPPRDNSEPTNRGVSWRVVGIWWSVLELDVMAKRRLFEYSLIYEYVVARQGLDA